MPVQILSDIEREAWQRFPERLDGDALGVFFTLTGDDFSEVRRLRGDENRPAVALQVCSLRWLGFIPQELLCAPERAFEYLAEQLDLDAALVFSYGDSPRTRSEHARLAQRIAPFRPAEPGDLARVYDPWSLARWSITRRWRCFAGRAAGLGRSGSCGPV